MLVSLLFPLPSSPLVLAPLSMYYLSPLSLSLPFSPVRVSTQTETRITASTDYFRVTSTAPRFPPHPPPDSSPPRSLLHFRPGVHLPLSLSLSRSAPSLSPFDPPSRLSMFVLLSRSISVSVSVPVHPLFVCPLSFPSLPSTVLHRGSCARACPPRRAFLALRLLAERTSRWTSADAPAL
jgi:hypothetical protein